MQSIQPYTGELLSRWAEHSDAQCDDFIRQSHALTIDRDDFPLKALQLAALFRRRKVELATLITSEMGKPITQSIQEVEKCALCCEYYAENASQFLRDETLATEYDVSIIKYEAFGVWLAIMPWNFPLWQVIRCAIPCLAAGNKLLLKHASNVQGCAFELEKLFLEAGFVEGEFRNACVASDKVSQLIQHPLVRGVSFTGSDNSGSQVAAIAGANIKPVILELGGSNAFIVTETADISKAVEDLIIGRFQNNGQSCIAAKRLLLDRKIQDEFTDVLLERMQSLQVGDPLLKETFIGPLAKPELNDALITQLQQSVEMGAVVLCGGRVEHGIFLPTLISNVTLEMPCMQEELFGPVLPIFPFDSMEQAIKISNSTSFGLGVSVYGKDTNYLYSLVSQWNEGAVFINSIVKSDPRFPFGGVKRSGIGRELGREGILALTQKKIVVISNSSSGA